MSEPVYLIATMDSKGHEIDFVSQVLQRGGVESVMVDVGTLAAPQVTPHVNRDDILHCIGKSSADLPADRGEAIGVMGKALAAFLRMRWDRGQMGGVLGVGGSGGTALIAEGLRALPIGFPKVLVSTVASGNTAPYVDCCDIMMMFSVVDIAGLNAVSRPILANAANAIAGMVRGEKPSPTPKPTIGMTMFGVTTPCVDRVRQALTDRGYDCLVFHATGTGGRAMEQLVESGLIQGVLDITTTEVADEIVGGVFPAGSRRFDRLLQAKIPLVLSLGAVDMVNFGGLASVPERFKDRTLHVHNSNVTLMRTNREENRAIAEWIARKLNQATAPWSLLIPAQGVSLLDQPGQPFHDPEADQVLFERLEESIEPASNRRIVRLPYHVNDPAFSAALVDEFLRLAATHAVTDAG